MVVRSSCTRVRLEALRVAHDALAACQVISTMEQLVLDLGLPASPPRTVVTVSNAAGYAMVESWPRWPHHGAMVLGGEGCGKSHLAQVYAKRAGGTVVGGSDLWRHDLVALAAAPVALDDAHLADERSLFHLINAVREARSSLLMTARPWPVTLADLGSRLRAVPEETLRPPDDGLLAGVLRQAFEARQLPADPSVIAYLVLRMDRTLHAAFALVDAMDRAGLASRRGPTRPLAADVLRIAGSSRASCVP